MKVKAIYMGQRAVTNSSAGAAYQVDGKTVYFRHVKHGEIGREYYLEKKDKSYQSRKFPDEVNEDLSVVKTAQVKKWMAQEADDLLELKKARRAKKNAKDPELETIVRKLAEYCDGLMFFEMKDVVDYCVSKVNLKMQAKK